MFDLRHAAVRYRLGLLGTEALVHIADLLLEEGCDSAAAVQLATLESPVMPEVAPLFERACAECGIIVPSMGEAIDEMLRFHVESIASGVRPPREALGDLMSQVYYPHISHESVREFIGDSRGLEQLIGAYWSYDDFLERPDCLFKGRQGEAAIPFFDEHVRELARAWLRR
ncbi:MAG: hypothetical protein K1X53_13195 [Candidatus Sumerlaeaceae bacterium]|nr:hypothetical protein [Candidatus Sumerlaeaceae bacterium]